MEKTRRRTRKRAVQAKREPKKTRREPKKGKRYTAAQKQHALQLVVDGTGVGEAAGKIGTTYESLRRWRVEAEAAGTMPSPSAAAARQTAEDDLADADGSARASRVAASRDQQLADAIESIKREHPSYQPAQVRAQLKRFRGWRVSLKEIDKVFRAKGYERVHRGRRSQGDEPVRFEAPRPNALWQMDFCELRAAGEKWYLAIAIDDYSRFVVGHALCDSPSSENAVAVLRAAIAKHGMPEKVRTDRGGAFLARTEPDDFARVLEAELIDHVVGRPYRPQGGGKVEAMIRTIRRELWDVHHMESRAHAEQELAAWLANYNERRAHMGIDGLTPADRYFGRADRVLAALCATARRRAEADAPEYDEAADGASPQATEVLRLMIVDGTMELRFCGARLPLGRIDR